MKRTTIVNLNKSPITEMFFKNRLLLSLSAIYILGIILGTVFIKKATLINGFVATNFSSYLDVRLKQNFFNILINSFLKELPLFLIIFFCGTSIVGVVLSPLVIAYIGFEYGAICGYIYSCYSLKGIALNILIIIPCALIALLGYLLASKEAFTFSLKLAKMSLPNTNSANIYGNFQTYCKRFLILALFIATSSLIDGLMSILLIKFFNF